MRTSEVTRARPWHTVRFRVTAAAMAAVLVVLAVTGVALVVLQRRVLTENLDESLQRQAAALAAQLERDGLPAVLVVGGDDDATAQVVAADGTVLASSANLAGQPATATANATAGEATRTVDGVGADDVAYRLVSRAAELPDGTVTVVHVASPLDDIEESVAALTLSLVVLVPVAALALGSLVWWLVGRTLRPVEEICVEVAGMDGTDLDRRVPQPHGDDEIARLARTMNEMLGRVEDAVSRQRQFVADASHELRTPLTRMRAELEVDLAHPERADPTTTMASQLEEVEGLQRLVEDLLLLARGEAPTGIGRDALVDLDDLALAEAERLREANDLQVSTAGLSAAQVRGDPEELRRALRNLTDNAQRHARSSVELAVREVDGRAEIRVADDGPGIPPEARELVFERFTRLDDARSATTGGTGLGLAIVREIVEGHGGTVRVDDTDDGGACFVVTLPLA